MDSKEQREYILTGFAFTVFFAVISYQLTNASLWFDETIEYWYSKNILGPLPWPDGSYSMYERIVSTFQPPLFNFLMYFWLKIHDSEWWLRMFGVLMGLIGAGGVYKTVQFGTNSRNMASVSVLFYAMISRLAFYWQEVAEYSLMLGVLSWTIFFFLRVIEKPDTRQIVLFVLFCILPVYSQYGAVFPVMAFGVAAFVRILMNRDGKQIKTLLLSYGTALIVAAAPLYFFFLKPQMMNQGVNEIGVSNVFRLKDFLDFFLVIFQWNFISSIGKTGEHILTFIMLLMIVAAVIYTIRGRKLWMRCLLAANMLCYLLYYFAVFFGVYGYGRFEGGNRYCLFFAPLWFVTALLLLFAIFSELLQDEKVKYSFKAAGMMGGVVIGGLLCWSYIEWNAIANNWHKEDIRDVADLWMEWAGYETDTIVYCAANGGFSYYVMHDSRYTDETFDKVVFQHMDRGETREHYRKWVDSIYEEWPSTLYVVASHFGEDVYELTDVFAKENYNVSEVYYQGENARLFYIEKIR